MPATEGFNYTKIAFVRPQAAVRVADELQLDPASRTEQEWGAPDQFKKHFTVVLLSLEAPIEVHLIVG